MRYLPHTLILAATLTLTGCAHKPGLGSYLDAGSTFAALSSGFAEANPALSWAPTPAATAIASIAVKHAAKVGLAAAGLPAETSHRAVETGGMFGAGWNLSLMAGASGLVPLVGGFGAALWYWVWGNE